MGLSSHVESRWSGTSPNLYGDMLRSWVRYLCKDWSSEELGQKSTAFCSTEKLFTFSCSHRHVVLAASMSYIGRNIKNRLENLKLLKSTDPGAFTRAFIFCRVCFSHFASIISLRYYTPEAMKVHIFSLSSRPGSPRRCNSFFEILQMVFAVESSQEAFVKIHGDVCPAADFPSLSRKWEKSKMPQTVVWCIEKSFWRVYYPEFFYFMAQALLINTRILFAV